MLTARTSTPTGDIAALALEQAGRLFRDHISPTLLETAEAGTWPAELWDAISAAGLNHALAPEALGGADIDTVTASLLIRLAGYHAVPVPLAETMLASSLWARTTGQLPQGVGSLAPCNGEDRIEIRGAGSGLTLNGKLRGVPWAESADFILVQASDETSKKLLALIPRGSAQVVPGKNLAGEPRGTLIFERTPLAKQNLAECSPEGCDLLEAGAFIRALQMVGAMERCLDLALEYAQQRTQFGRPIGKFQAVQHMLAEGAGHYAAALVAANLAARHWNTKKSRFSVAVAKARAGEGAGRISEICHQIHGAMGFAREHPLHFSTRRLLAWRDEFAGESYWQTDLGEGVCAGGGSSLWRMITDMD
jgi:acyl-CoA dehydrogenase